MFLGLICTKCVFLTVVRHVVGLPSERLCRISNNIIKVRLNTANNWQNKLSDTVEQPRTSVLRHWQTSWRCHVFSLALRKPTAGERSVTTEVIKLTDTDCTTTSWLIHTERDMCCIHVHEHDMWCHVFIRPCGSLPGRRPLVLKSPVVMSRLSKRNARWKDVEGVSLSLLQ